MKGYGRSLYKANLGMWGHWFAGFVDGEGAFMLISQKAHGNTRPTIMARFSLSQRADDKTVIDEIKERLGFGEIYLHSSVNSLRLNEKPSYRFQAHRKEDCLKLVKIFRKYPLHSRKARQFELWAEAVETMKWAKGSHSRKRYEYLSNLVPQLRSLRDWNPHTLIGK